MAYKSLDQERYFHMAMNEGKMKPGTVKKFDDASRGMEMPEKAPMKKPFPPKAPAPAMPPHPAAAPVPALAGPAGPEIPGMPPTAPGGFPKIKSTQGLRDLFKKKFGTKPGMDPMGE